ncbi:MAG: hypothetical protein A2X49_02100 [Lentisphaerae bacterium GWF2_52_8]|nr:MAG: hypothetical protein A2X49_02100 [Lentisphaerae bacterium GWF2_52_8]
MDNIDITELMKPVPAPKHGGGRPFKQGVINPWRVINDFELFIFTEGDARMTVDDVDYECPDGQFLIMRPATRHLSVCLSKQVFVRWAHFDWNAGAKEAYPQHGRVQEKTVDFEFSLPSFCPKGIVTGRLEGTNALALHDRMCAKLNAGGAQSKRMAQALFLQELLTLLDSPELNSASLSRPDERLAYEAMSKLHLIASMPHRETASLQDVLGELRRSYAHVERCFKQHFGMSPEKYISGLRMNKAGEMLLETALNVSEIAEELGYDDPGYFSRQFTKHAGMSPSKFRNVQRYSLKH